MPVVKIDNTLTAATIEDTSKKLSQSLAMLKETVATNKEESVALIAKLTAHIMELEGTYNNTIAYFMKYGDLSPHVHRDFAKITVRGKEKIRKVSFLTWYLDGDIYCKQLDRHFYRVTASTPDYLAITSCKGISFIEAKEPSYLYK